MSEIRIDPTLWPRRLIYQHYRGMGNPYLSLTVDVDCTDMYASCKARKRSLFAVMMWRLARAANTVPQLRQRIRLQDDEHVVEHDIVHTAFTVGAANGLFSYADAPLVDDEAEFCELVAAASAVGAQADLIPMEGKRDDLLFLSCLPWVHFTAISHPMDTGATHTVDTVPRVAWGRISQRGDRRVLPVNIQAHHALVDGGHLGAFYRALEHELGEAKLAGP